MWCRLKRKQSKQSKAIRHTSAQDQKISISSVLKVTEKNKTKTEKASSKQIGYGSQEKVNIKANGLIGRVSGTVDCALVP